MVLSFATASIAQRDLRRALFPTWRCQIRIHPNLPSTIRDQGAAHMMDTATTASLELDDIQSGALHARPSPYVGTYLLVRIDDRQAGREMVRRLLRVVDSAEASSEPARDAWVTAAFTYQGLEALG